MIRPALAFVLSFAFACGSGSAANEVGPRHIPIDAPSGRVSATTAWTLDIDGKTLRLAPGARIYNANNTTVTPNLVPAGSKVRYVFDERGQLRTVWIVEDNSGRRTTPRVPGYRP